MYLYSKYAEPDDPVLHTCISSAYRSNPPHHRQRSVRVDLHSSNVFSLMRPNILITIYFSILQLTEV